MCGIAGIICQNRIDLNCEIQKMTNAISHRGPDGEGFFINNNVAIGHRRLAIIDLNTGHQPIFNEDQTLSITYNGELYNYLELKEILIIKGHKFHTSSDTEVIVHAYEQWGKECVKHFRGMFAFAIVDTNRKEVFIARDHFGIKPLVYYQNANYFAFASEIQALTKIEDFEREIDIEAIDQYLYLQYIPAPKTIYKKVKKILPAYRMCIGFNGIIKYNEKYWSLKFKPNLKLNEADWLEGLEEVLRDSVKAHLISDVPFGAFLSGGVDSTIVVTYMAEILKMPIKTFSIGFEDEAYNELRYAQTVAQKWETEHYTEIVKPDAMSILPKLVKHYGEPFGDSSAIPTYYVSELAKKHVTMILSGDGGDESFAGYPLYVAWKFFLDEKKVNRAAWKQKLYPLVSKIIPNKYPHQKDESRILNNWLNHIQYTSNDLRSFLWKDIYKEHVNLPVESFESEFEKALKFSPLNRVQYMDLKTYLPNDILTKVDIAAMIHSLETRTPLVDKKVIEYVTTIPENFNFSKIKDDYQGKLLLKKLLNKHFTPDFTNREKKGFAVPINKWFLNNGPSQIYVKERLLDSPFLKEYFNEKGLKLINEQQKACLLWLLLVLDEWLIQNS